MPAPAFAANAASTWFHCARGTSPSLASNAGHTQSRTTLFQELYGRDYDGVDRILDVRISQIRKKLGETESSERIKTIWGQGYLFVADVW